MSNKKAITWISYTLRECLKSVINFIFFSSAPMHSPVSHNTKDLSLTSEELPLMTEDLPRTTGELQLKQQFHCLQLMTYYLHLQMIFMIAALTYTQKQTQKIQTQNLNFIQRQTVTTSLTRPPPDSGPDSDSSLQFQSRLLRHICQNEHTAEIPQTDKQEKEN